MTISAEQMSTFAALHRQWWRLHLSEKISSGTKSPNKRSKFYYMQGLRCSKTKENVINVVFHGFDIEYELISLESFLLNYHLG